MDPKLQLEVVLLLERMAVQRCVGGCHDKDVDGDCCECRAFDLLNRIVKKNFDKIAQESQSP